MNVKKQSDNEIIKTPFIMAKLYKTLYKNMTRHKRSIRCKLKVSTKKS